MRRGTSLPITRSPRVRDADQYLLILDETARLFREGKAVVSGAAAESPPGRRD
jgi:hypothetical protein